MNNLLTKVDTVANLWGEFYVLELLFSERKVERNSLRFIVIKIIHHHYQHYYYPQMDLALFIPDA